MKLKLIGFLLGLGLLCAHAQEEKVIAELNGESPFILKTPSFQPTVPSQKPEILTLSRIDQTTNGAWEPELMAILFRIPNPEIATGWYAITGEVAYQNLPSNSELVMAASYLGTDSEKGGTYTSQTNENVGPQKTIVGTSEFRPFMVPLKLSDSGKLGKLIQLEFNVALAGQYLPNPPTGAPHTETVSFRNVKLVQYSDTPLAQMPAPPPTVNMLLNVEQSDAGTQYSLDGVDYSSPDAVTAAAAATLQNHLGSPLVIRAARNVPYKAIAQLLDEARKRGITSISFATPKDAPPSAESPSATPTSDSANPIPLTSDQSDEQREHALKVRWFCIGFGATTSILFILAGSAIILHTLRKRTNEREMRRIASLDS